MAEETEMESLKDQLELLRWVLYSFREPSAVFQLSPQGRLKEIAIKAEYESFRSWALKQIEQ